MNTELSLWENRSPSLPAILAGAMVATSPQTVPRLKPIHTPTPHMRMWV